jgi:hypothetical protein
MPRVALDPFPHTKPAGDEQDQRTALPLNGRARKKEKKPPIPGDFA